MNKAEKVLGSLLLSICISSAFIVGFLSASRPESKTYLIRAPGVHASILNAYVNDAVLYQITASYCIIDSSKIGYCVLNDTVVVNSVLNMSLLFGCYVINCTNYGCWMDQSTIVEDCTTLPI